MLVGISSSPTFEASSMSASGLSSTRSFLSAAVDGARSCLTDGSLLIWAVSDSKLAYEPICL